MYNLFTENSDLNFSLTYFPEFDVVRRTYIRELSNVVDFYRTRVYAVKSNHFLANLINHLSVPLQYAVDRYADVAAVRAPYLAKAMNMTSDINTGQLFPGVFYGPGVKEIILYDDSYFNPFYAEREWERIAAVKVLLHPKSDMGLLLPNGRSMSDGDGLAVISVNIPLLAVQYRSFMAWQRTKTTVEGELLGISHFIHMYVLPNMLYSQVDISLFNRFMNICIGAPMGKPKLKHSFSVLDYTKQLDHVLDHVADKIRSTSERFEQILKQVPGIISVNSYDALAMPDITQTQQAFWALILSRLEIMSFLIDLAGEDTLRQNRIEITDLKRTLMRFRNSHIYEKVLKGELLLDVNNLISHILDDTP